jgi:hypothetical protein
MSQVNPRRVPSHTFLCCIPVRVGVVFLALVGALGGLAMTAFAIIQIKHSPGTTGNKVALVVQIVIYILLAIVSVFGLIGAISRKRSFVRSYLWMVFVHLLLSIGLGIYAIVHNFKDAPKYIDECASGSDDPSVLKSCQDGSKLFKGIMIAVFIFVWLLEIWACSIVNSYSNQLREEEVKDSENW